MFGCALWCNDPVVVNANYRAGQLCSLTTGCPVHTPHGGTATAHLWAAQHYATNAHSRRTSKSCGPHHEPSKGATNIYHCNLPAEGGTPPDADGVGQRFAVRSTLIPANKEDFAVREKAI